MHACVCMHVFWRLSGSSLARVWAISGVCSACRFNCCMRLKASTAASLSFGLQPQSNTNMHKRMQPHSTACSACSPRTADTHSQDAACTWRCMHACTCMHCKASHATVMKPLNLRALHVHATKVASPKASLFVSSHEAPRKPLFCASPPAFT